MAATMDLMKLKNKKLFLFDIDGTLAVGNTLYDGSAELLSYIDKVGGKSYFITNNSTKSSADYVEKFREEIPRYMIKHQVRPGMTGWAQINGYRGNTSIRKRIDHDLYYIENWTLGLDFKILFLTIFRGFINKNAY